MSRRGIQTHVRGITYRSRVEAQWAILFDDLGFRVEYEPVDGRGYIPDFALVDNTPLLVEVKDHLTLGELAGHTDRIDAALEGVWDHDVMIVGGSPFLGDIAYDCAGLMRQRGPDGEPWWERALWMRCQLCRRVGFYHEMGGWDARPCGHYDGDHHIAAPPRERISTIWTAAREETRWTPR